MATSMQAVEIQHHAPQESSTKTQNESATVTLEQISISQLLGRDYLFIDARTNPGTFATPQQIQATIEDVVTRLKLTDNHMLFIGVHEGKNGDVLFMRHEVSWDQQQFVTLETVAISNQEQQDFMSMIWQCSTPVE